MGGLLAACRFVQDCKPSYRGERRRGVEVAVSVQPGAYSPAVPCAFRCRSLSLALSKVDIRLGRFHALFAEAPEGNVYASPGSADPSRGARARPLRRRPVEVLPGQGRIWLRRGAAGPRWGGAASV